MLCEFHINFFLKRKTPKPSPHTSWKIKPNYQCKNWSWSFPGGAAVENPPANAGDTGSSPGLGTSHTLWSNWAHEPQLLSLRVWSLCSAARKAAIVRGTRTAMKNGAPLAATRESPRAETKTQHSQK